MDSEEFKKYLSDRYHPQIDWYDKKSIYNQRMYKRMQFFLIIFSSLTPILIIIEKLEELESLGWLYRIPATTAVIVAIFTSLIKTFRFQENWINYRTTCETLKKELYYYEAALDEYEKVDNKESIFVRRVENLISRENTLWLSSNEPGKDKK